MDWQQLVSLSIVVAAACLLVGKKFQRRKFSFERDTHCGCSAIRSQTSQQSSIVFRSRKGGRPEVRVKIK